jgi:hypothetical protein
VLLAATMVDGVADSGPFRPSRPGAFTMPMEPDS